MSHQKDKHRREEPKTPVRNVKPTFLDLKAKNILVFIQEVIASLYGKQTTPFISETLRV